MRERGKVRERQTDNEGVKGGKREIEREREREKNEEDDVKAAHTNKNTQ